jgi:hypothetical protein
VAIDWTAVMAQLAATGTVAAALAWVAKALGQQWLSRDLEVHKAALKRESDAALEAQKALQARELEAVKSALARELEAAKAGIAAAAARGERARVEIERWASPIRGAVRDLERRLVNIQAEGAWIALSPDPEARVPGWTIGHDYFLRSTAYLFCQYFCWAGLLRRQLRFDLFRDGLDRNDFLALLRAADRCLSSWPLDPPIEAPPGDLDRPVFNLEQRAIGESCVVGQGAQEGCIGYASFLDRWEDPAFRTRIAPLLALLSGLSPETKHRWERLSLLRDALNKVDTACAAVLDPTAAKPV